MKAGVRYLLLTVSLLFALSVPLFAVRFVAFLLFFLLLLSAVHNSVVPRMIGVHRLDPELRAGRQQPMASRIALTSSLPIPVPRVVLLESPGRLYCDNPATEHLLRPYGNIAHSEILRGEHRGVYQYGPLHLHGYDPFGLIGWERHYPVLGQAVIRPRIPSIQIEDRRGVAGGRISAASPAYEDVTRFQSIREYVAGDDPKRVNWKASAKSGRLYTTEYERSLTVGVTIVLNLLAADYPPRRRDQSIERAVEVAAAIAFNYGRRGQPVGLLAAASLSAEARGESVSHPHGSGWTHTQKLLDTLARVASADGKVDYVALVLGRRSSLPAGGRLMIVGPEPNESQVEQLRTLRAHRLRIDYYWVGAESAVSSDSLDGVCPTHRVAEIGDVLNGR